MLVLGNMERLEREAGLTPNIDRVLVPAVSEAEDEPYGATPREREIRFRFEQLLTAAAGDQERLGWVSQQMHAHLTPPQHWFTAAQLAARETERQKAIDEAKSRMPELQGLPQQLPQAKVKAG